MADWVDNEHLRGDLWTRVVALSTEELAYQRTVAVTQIHGYDRAITQFTCDACSRRFICKPVFDWYNTNGV